MRKIITSVNITLDGFMSGPHRELDWHFRYWTEEMTEITGKELSKADTILLGRITYEAMAAYWPKAASDLSFPKEDLAIAEMMNNHTKVVFSRSLLATSWKNARLASGDIRREIGRLKHDKEQNGKNIITYGSHTLVSSLMQLDLIDEYLLWVHPVILGEGNAFFSKPSFPRKLRLVSLDDFTSGVVLLRYQSARKTSPPMKTMSLVGAAGSPLAPRAKESRTSSPLL